MSRQRAAQLHLTQRALADLQQILEYSAQQWGRRVADDYITGMEAALNRIRENPELLRAEPALHPALTFYRVQKHLLVCDSQDRSIIVLTVIHATMDIPSRLADIQPQLAMEVELLHRQLRGGG